jgi:hypothetical protein
MDKIFANASSWGWFQLIFGGTTEIQGMQLARGLATQSRLASRQVPVIAKPGLRRDHDSAKAAASIQQTRQPFQAMRDLPFFRSSVIPRGLTWERLQQPSSRALTLLTDCSPCL